VEKVARDVDSCLEDVSLKRMRPRTDHVDDWMPSIRPGKLAAAARTRTQPKTQMSGVELCARQFVQQSRTCGRSGRRVIEQLDGSGEVLAESTWNENAHHQWEDDDVVVGKSVAGAMLPMVKRRSSHVSAASWMARR
jgi:hypothetical protein